MPAVPDPRQAACFRYTGREYDPLTGEARLKYRFDDGPELVEVLRFPHAPWPPEASRQLAFDGALRLLHAIAGVSYYKAGLPPEIRFDDPGEVTGLTGFLEELFVQGLAEFAFVNGLDLAGRVRFPVASRESRVSRALPVDLVLPDRALVAMGGGKDSLVGLDFARQAGLEVMPFSVGRNALIRDTVDVAGLPLIQIERRLAPELLEMNEAGAWNGHVPVTAINSAIGLCAAILYGFRQVVFSNERSADEASLWREDGSAVNHQYSKGSAFEAAFRNVIARELSGDLEYFSILRPFSELAIAQRFSSMRRYHFVYSSCNRNFHLDGPRTDGRWCRDCPKCRFGALGLALFLSPADVAAIMGGDMLDQSQQIDGFRALCGLGRDKPFECVGEIGESRAALAALNGRRPWREHAVVRALAPELESVEVPDLESLLRASPKHFIPARVEAELRAKGVLDGQH